MKGDEANGEPDVRGLVDPSNADATGAFSPNEDLSAITEELALWDETSARARIEKLRGQLAPWSLGDEPEVQHVQAEMQKFNRWHAAKQLLPIVTWLNDHGAAFGEIHLWSLVGEWLGLDADLHRDRRALLLLARSKDSLLHPFRDLLSEALTRSESARRAEAPVVASPATDVPRSEESSSSPNDGPDELITEGPIIKSPRKHGPEPETADDAAADDRVTGSAPARDAHPAMDERSDADGEPTALDEPSSDDVDAPTIAKSGASEARQVEEALEFMRTSIRAKGWPIEWKSLAAAIKKDPMDPKSERGVHATTVRRWLDLSGVRAVLVKYREWRELLEERDLARGATTAHGGPTRI